MLVLPSNVTQYVSMWIESILKFQNKTKFVVPVTGGVDSAVCGALCLTMNMSYPIIFIKMGYKPNEEDYFEDWVKVKYGLYNKNVTFVTPTHPQIQLGDLLDNNFDNREVLLGMYVNLIAKSQNALSVGNTNRTEYSLLRETNNVFDCYPIIDLYRDEVVNIGEVLELPSSILKSESRFEKEFGISFVELQWLDRQNEISGIIFTDENPSSSKYWGLYSQRQKEIITKVYAYYRQHKHTELLEKKMCNVRKTLPGIIS